MKKTKLQDCININNNVWNAIYSVSASIQGVDRGISSTTPLS
jgi:hypothetical protein